MRKIIDFFSWGFLLLFFIPTGLILASWNALPGDRFYGTKLAFESTLLALAKPSLAASGSLSIKYTERRFSETKQLLANKHSVKGLPYLNRQVVETKTIIAAGPPSTTQRELARAYLVSLQNVSAQLEQQKQIALAQTSQTNTQLTLTQQRSAPAPVLIASSPTQTVQAPQVTTSPQQEPAQTSQTDVQTVAQAGTVAEIAQTQETISQTIDELEQLTNQAPQQDKHDDKNQGKDEKKDNKEGQGQDSGKGKDHGD